MADYSSKYQVTIVGAGPVGLFLAARLNKFGISTLVLEKRSAPRQGSRSIGIHPVSLELFQKLNIANRFIEKGIKISNGLAYTNTQKIGTLSFEDCIAPFNFILSLPQVQTEQILEHYVANLPKVLIIRDAKVVGFKQEEQFVRIHFKHEGYLKKVESSFLIGCDGKNSITRQKANIRFEGKSYPDRYIMGDFSDNTAFGSNAAIFMCREGLIESFPLPQNKRRWVVKLRTKHPDVDRKIIDQQVYDRIGHTLFDTENTMVSLFGVQRYLANQMVQNRVILAGDAAHVVSPIGGQGMNLGWLGAWDLAQSLNEVLNHNLPQQKILRHFEKRRIKAAKNSMRRAELNMRLGRAWSFPSIRNGIISVMLNTPLSQLMVNIFTMRGVEKWII